MGQRYGPRRIWECMRRGRMRQAAARAPPKRVRYTSQARQAGRRATPAARWRGARVVEWDGLENRCTGNCTQGSNPCLSAFTSRSFSEGWLSFFNIAFFPRSAGFSGRSLLGLLQSIGGLFYAITSPLVISVAGFGRLRQSFSADTRTMSGFSKLLLILYCNVVLCLYP